MPVSVCEATASVNAALRESLGSGGSCSAAANSRICDENKASNNFNGGSSNLDEDADSLHGKLVASAKRVLLSKIEYEEVTNYNQSVLDTLKSKYIVLKSSSSGGNTENDRNSLATCNNNNNNGANGDGSDGTASTLNGGGNTTPGKKSQQNPNELPQPKRILFPRENVRVGWKATGRKWDIGVGMTNVGNTCYLNSTLQALFHVPSMANWLMSDSAHMERCEAQDSGCIICAMAKTLQSSQSNQSAIRPYFVYSKLKSICKHLVMGRQEDAHEFLRYLVEAMEKSYLTRFRNYKELDQHSKETTPLNQILGGYLKSAVRCLSCNHVSVTFQHFQDLLLDIRKADTIDEALEGYFSRERLEDMGYKCEACKKKVSATKQFSLERAPIALCIQLKRFSMLGTKINKQITIKPRLDLSKFSSRKTGAGGEQLTYRLVAMVTHLGASQHCGHYTAIGSTESGTYYNYDDSYVRPISVQNVCNTNAYIIFYEMDNQPRHVVSSTQVSGGSSSHAIQQKEQTPASSKVNGHVVVPASPQRVIGPQLPPGYNSLTSSPLSNGGSKLTLNRSSSSVVSSSATTSGSNNSKIMIHFKNSNAAATVKTSAATSSITTASATSTSSTSTTANNSLFDDLKNNTNKTINGNTTANKNSNGLHTVGTGKFQESTNSKYPLAGTANKRQTTNATNGNESSSTSDDDENEIVSSSTSTTLPSMPKLIAENMITTSTSALSSSSSKPLTNGLSNNKKSSPAATNTNNLSAIKSLVPYGSDETDDENDAYMNTNESTTKAKLLLPNPLKRRQSSSSSSNSDNDDVQDVDMKPSNGIKIKKAVSSTSFTTGSSSASMQKSPLKHQDYSSQHNGFVKKSEPDAIDKIFNKAIMTNGVSSSHKKKSQTQQFSISSTTPASESSSSSSASDSEENANNNTTNSNKKYNRPPFKRSSSTPPSPPIVQSKLGIWQVTPLQTPSSSSSSASASEKKSTTIIAKNPHNPFTVKTPVFNSDNAKRLKNGGKDIPKTYAGNGYQKNIANEPIVAELLKQSHRGYGTAVVQTWDGQQTEIEREIITEKRQQEQRDWEHYEENEMDRGRQKKVKSAKDSYGMHSSTPPGYNSFQEEENQRRWKRYNHHGGGGGGGNGVLHYRHNFNQRNKFKFQKFPNRFNKKFTGIRRKDSI